MPAPPLGSEPAMESATHRDTVPVYRLLSPNSDSALRGRPGRRPVCAVAAMGADGEASAPGSAYGLAVAVPAEFSNTALAEVMAEISPLTAKVAVTWKLPPTCGLAW